MNCTQRASATPWPIRYLWPLLAVALILLLGACASREGATGTTTGSARRAEPQAVVPADAEEAPATDLSSFDAEEAPAADLSAPDAGAGPPPPPAPAAAEPSPLATSAPARTSADEPAEFAADAAADPADKDAPAFGDGGAGDDASGDTGRGAPPPSTPLPGGDLVDGDGEDVDVAPGPTIAPLPTRTRMQGGPAPLKAGEIDDNTLFDAYLTYLATSPAVPVRRADVSERYILTVRNADQRPLFDATVRIYDEQQQEVFTGRTYAGGKTIFLPRVLGVSPNTQEFRAVAEYGGAQAQATFARDTTTPIELVVAGGQPADALMLDVMFLLDTTGSMGDELQRIQETIDDIAERIDGFEPRPNLRFGLVAFRDVGDDYVTRSYDFTPDVAAFRELLNGLDAGGGGDTPEALEQGLHEAVHGVDWSAEGVRLTFLVGDAGPHIDEQLGYTYLSDTQAAVARGIKIYPIAASNTDPQAEYVFRQLAQQTLSSFIFLTYQPDQVSGAPGETTPLEAGAAPYSVARLDDLIVGIVQRELSAAVGRP